MGESFKIEPVFLQIVFELSLEQLVKNEQFWVPFPDGICCNFLWLKFGNFYLLVIWPLWACRLYAVNEVLGTPFHYYNVVDMPILLLIIYDFHVFYINILCKFTHCRPSALSALFWFWSLPFFVNVLMDMVFLLLNGF